MIVLPRLTRILHRQTFHCTDLRSRFRTCQPRTMNITTAAEIAPPPINRDMKTLDRSFFKQIVETSALTVFDARDIQPTRAKLLSSRDILSTTTIKPVIDDETTPGAKCILMKPQVKASDPSTWSDKWSQVVKDGNAKIRPYTLTLTYDDYKMGDILDAVLPELSEEDEQNPASFAQVGHVAHINLREQFLPYKYLVGQVLLDKNPQVKTVINKLHDVGTESVFRTFPYEVLAGPDDLDVTVHHSNCEFKFNFSEVYWNSRNGHEHERLLSLFKPGEVLCDVTAGVGPFAIPAAKKGVWAWANDLNPACYKALCDAITRNKVSNFVCAFQSDGADFIKTATHRLLRQQRTFTKRPFINIPRSATPAEKEKLLTDVAAKSSELREPPTFDHYIMNLPATGIDFLPAFKGIYHGHERLFAPINGRRLPMVHVYTFQARYDEEDQERAELQKRLSESIGFELSDADEVYLHRARLVAPNKLYYCASFRLPAAVAFAAPTKSTD